MLIPLPLPPDLTPSGRPSAELARIPLGLAAAAGLGLAIAGGVTGSFWTLWSGAAVWFLSAFARERVSGRYSTGD